MNHDDMERKSTTAGSTAILTITMSTYIDLRKHFGKEVKSCGNKAFGVWCLRFLEGEASRAATEVVKDQLAPSPDRPPFPLTL